MLSTLFSANSELKSRSKPQFTKSDLSLLALEINRSIFTPEVSCGLVLVDVLSLMVQITRERKKSVLCQDCLTQEKSILNETEEEIQGFDAKDLSTSSVLPKRIKIVISILKTNETFRILLTHFRSSNPKTTFLKLKLWKKNVKGSCNSRNYVPERNTIALFLC